MKFNRNTHFYIAKNVMDSVFTKNEPIEYEKWVEFVDKNQGELIWYEKTKDGIKNLADIDKIPEGFKERVLNGLNKRTCLKEFDEVKGFFNVNCSFNSVDNWISIGFERTPRPDDLQIFLKMARHLDALLLKDGKEIIDEKLLDRLT